MRGRGLLLRRLPWVWQVLIANGQPLTHKTGVVAFGMSIVVAAA